MDRRNKLKPIVFGAGSAGQRALKKLQAEQYEVVAFVDNDSRLWGRIIGGLRVYSPGELLDLEFDRLVIASSFHAEILVQVLQLGVSAEKVRIFGKAFLGYDDEYLQTLLRDIQPADQPPLAGYQLEMAVYDVKTGMGDVEAEFLPLYRASCDYTMTSWQRLYNLYSTVKYLHSAGVPGAFVECGVWRGGSMMMAARTLLSLGATDRQLYLFDTFEGLPRPDETLDVDIWGHRAIDGWQPHRRTDQSSDWAYASLDEVHANMETTGYPMENVHFVQGMVEDTLPTSAPETLALLRLDTDWYASTKLGLEQLYPRLSRNGVLILDDYGHFRGARKAADEYFSSIDVPPLLNRVDYAGRTAIKVT